MKVRYPHVDGVYDHYKGGRYKVISLAKHSETQEVLVVYASLLFGSVYVRPLSMWFDKIQMDDGTETERFVLSGTLF